MFATVGLAQATRGTPIFDCWSATSVALTYTAGWQRGDVLSSDKGRAGEDGECGGLHGSGGVE